MFLVALGLALSAGQSPTRGSNLWPRMAMNAAQHIIVNLLKISFFCSSVFVSVCVFNVGPKTTLPFPVWPRDAERPDTPSGPQVLLTPPAAAFLH